MILNSEDTFLSLGNSTQNQGGPVEIEDVGEDLEADFGENYSKLKVLQTVYAQCMESLTKTSFFNCCKVASSRPVYFRF